MTPSTPVICCICEERLLLSDQLNATCWSDPSAQVVAAHNACLIRLGEDELDLPHIDGAR